MIKSKNITHVSGLPVLFLISGFLILFPDSSKSASDFLSIARNYAEAILQHATDRYGPEHTAMWAQIIDLRTLRIPEQQTAAEWNQEMASWEEDKNYGMWGKNNSNLEFAPMSNLNWDGSTIRLMMELSQLTGDDHFRRGAQAYMKDFFARCISPVNGLFGWGLHLAYDMRKDSLYWHRHESNWWDPLPWAEVWAERADLTEAEIRAIYRGHIQDKRTYAFDRHAEFYTNDFPFETNCFAHHGLSYMEAFAFAYGRTGNPEYWRWCEEMLLSLWGKRNPSNNALPGNWRPDQQKLGYVKDFTDGPWLAEYVLSAYEDCGEPFLAEVAAAFLYANGQRKSVSYARDARVMLRASRLLTNPEFFALAKTFADSLKNELVLPQMAFDVAHHLLLYIELYEATGEEKWRQAALTFAEKAAKEYVHSSGLIAGTAGLKRPLYYDVAQGPGMLAAAFFRLGLIQHGLTPTAIRTDKSWSKKDLPKMVTCRIPGSSVKRAHLILQKELREKTLLIEGKRQQEQWIFPLQSSIFKGKKQLRYQVVAVTESGTVASPWQFIRTEGDWEPPIIADLNLPAQALAASEIPISTHVSDTNGLRSVELLYMLDDRQGYPPISLQRQGDRYAGKLSLPKDEIPQRLSLAVRAVDQCDNSVLNPWQQMDVFAQDVLDGNQGGGGKQTGVTVVCPQVQAPHPITVRRYWRLSEEIKLQPSQTHSEVFFSIQGTHQTAGIKTLSFPFTPEQVAAFLPGTQQIIKSSPAGWTAVPTEIDLDNQHLTISGELIDGIYTVSGQDRLIWSGQVLHGENVCQTFIDVNSDSIPEIACGTGGHGVGLLTADGSCSWSQRLGQVFRNSGGTFSHPAVLDINGDRKPVIIIGSEDGNVRCFDANGNLLWSFQGHGQIRSGIAVDTNRTTKSIALSFTDAAGFVYLIDASGKPIWQQHLASEFFTTPAFYDLDGDGSCEIICGSRDDDLIVLNHDGSTRWRKHLDGDVSAPAIGRFQVESRASVDERSCAITVGTTAGTVFAFDPQGNLIWQAKTPPPTLEGWNEPDLVLMDVDGDGWREVAMASKNGRIHLLDSHGNERWGYATKAKIQGSIAFANVGGGPEPDLIFGSYDNKIYALDGWGRLLWFFADKRMEQPAQLLVGDVNGDSKLEIVANCVRPGGFFLLRTEAPCRRFSRPWWTYHGNLARTGAN